MNIFHFILIGIYILGFVATLYKHGKKKKETTYNAIAAFWIASVAIILVYLSSIF